ncbi:3-oxo-tetronate kinase [Mesorhizobium sp.]|uniref:3-oxo-tetronate kinase n=1 Tax=Mesorhizobium sp. TaxID=1871066 RepID=UPI000FE5F4CD|nr:3-oxo-tetronate kinase [Mesorhizobium sp.]RWK43424.1 MAG: four-carbon acid sugar kinase family protein [Mesorhizobium sp.]RWK69948.1 MAG: four-carbon acid sugar kinase family protein [Mesorhizobium sp.]RWK77143.1 MAG: four-carbon acid sugar kinase family protein [Mesorhizobium sp.]RWK80129.1 MAG: four-carbon acid sugar kinase family protein [Mesorhizobium sp.]RWL01431.1 MAG: four-carbon acid sugar kinase family protein [Mesorhizobium sp.]
MTAARPFQPLIFGAVADDLTGGLELASMLVARGVPTTLSIGAREPARIGAAHVFALKSRVAPVGDAVRSALEAVEILQSHRARQIFFKYCATFDSTPAGNIGPCADAMMDRLGARQALFVPAFCEMKRTVYQGHMFAGAQLLSESPKRFDPVTPMTDSNLVRVLQAQTKRVVGLVDYSIVDQGPDAIRVYCERQHKRSPLFIADALYEHHLSTLAAAALDAPFLTGNSCVAAHLPPLWLERGLIEEAATARLNGVDGTAAVLVGSLAPQTTAQLDRFGAENDVFVIDVARAFAGHDVSAEARQFAAASVAAGRSFAISTALPQDRVDSLQSAHGRLDVASRAEALLSEIAQFIVFDLGVRRLVVAGGETSGSVVRALGITDLEVGPYREPGFSRAVAAHPFPIALLLKSGKLGSVDIFASALDDMRRPILQEPLLTRWPAKD